MGKETMAETFQVQSELLDSYRQDFSKYMPRIDLLAIYRGKLAEQFVAQELLAWHGSDLFYWSREARSSSAEVDYLTVFEGNIYPIEVKSGAGGSLRSLHLMLGKYPNYPGVKTR